MAELIDSTAVAIWSSRFIDPGGKNPPRAVFILDIRFVTPPFWITQIWMSCDCCSTCNPIKNRGTHKRIKNTKTVKSEANQAFPFVTFF